MSAATIAHLSHSQIDEVLSLWRSCGLLIPHRDSAWDAYSALKNNTSTILVGSVNGRIVSSALASFEGHRGWLYYVAVAPSMQGQGLGEQIIRAAEEWLKKRGAPKAMLLVHSTNTKVIGFYHSLGYSVEPLSVLGKWWEYPPLSNHEVSLAEQLARRAHAGQLDKSGADYILHPERVAQLVHPIDGSSDANSAAWLHDVVEDTPLTASDLLQAGISPTVVDAVVALTRLPSQTPEEYFAAVRANPIARAVKIADLMDNCSPTRLSLLDAETATRLRAKYQRSWELLFHS